MPTKRPVRPSRPPLPNSFRRIRPNPGRSARAHHAVPPMMTGPVLARSCKPCAIVPPAHLISPPRLAVSSGLLAAWRLPRSTARRCEVFLRRRGSALPPSLLATVLFVPVLFFFLLAHMFTRAQDMRVIAESMAEVAMRLAQPETIAHESIVTVGQAIRREVAAMGDGVERALARAAELEALVHNEVSALERAYNDNEVRIRDLLTELSNQRETLVNQAEH